MCDESKNDIGANLILGGLAGLAGMAIFGAFDGNEDQADLEDFEAHEDVTLDENHGEVFDDGSTAIIDRSWVTDTTVMTDGDFTAVTFDDGTSVCNF